MNIHFPAFAQIAAQTAPDALAHIRLLETTDVHSNLLPYDYYADQDDRPYGLARTATLIGEARSEVANTLLFDNGDALQGTPMSDMTAQKGSGWIGPHPAISAMNLLGYDAATLGNHEFNFGLDWLSDAISAAAFPVTCANIDMPHGRDTSRLLPQYLLLDRDITDMAGNTHQLRIGVIGLVPPQITTWDQFHLRDCLQSHDMVDTATRLVPQLRTEGAELILLLAHTGIDAGPAHPFMENAALPLAAIPGVDAIMTGHVHGIFPSSAFDGIPGVDTKAGTLHGTPAVMAGFRGSHLGVLDLLIQRTGNHWTLIDHRAEARAVLRKSTTPIVISDARVNSALSAAHRSTLALTRRPIGATDTPLHSYLSLAGLNRAEQLVMEAQRAHLSKLLADHPDSNLPILSAAAPFKTGGRGGPGYFTEVASGPLTLRHAADLYVFPNMLCGLRMSGADLSDWLERAAICFNQITPAGGDQLLCDPGIPGHNFEIVSGLTYSIDLSQPARFSLTGACLAPDARRICNLRHKGRTVQDDDMFIVASNSYRASGSGPYPQPAAGAVIYEGRTPMRDVLADHIREHGTAIPQPGPVWSFEQMPGMHVLFDTGPGLRAFPQDMATMKAEDLGNTAQGFARLRLPL